MNKELVAQKINSLFLLGFPRCASSSLSAILNTHPEIALPSVKGSDFFSTDEYNEGKKYFFEKYFDNSWEQKKYVGDDNPVHSFLPYIPKRIKESFPEAKLIFSLRNPVDRAYSNWWHNREADKENLSFEDSIALELKVLEEIDLEDEEYWTKYRRKMLGSLSEWRSVPRFYLLRGYYAVHIKRYLEYFSNDQIYYINFSEFKNSPKEEIEKVFDFLSLEDSSEVKFDQHVNSAIKNIRVRNLIDRVNKYKIDSVVPSIVKNGIKKIVNKTTSKSQMDDDMREMLQEFYREKNEELYKLVDLGNLNW